MLEILETSIPLGFVLAWWLLVNPAIEALPEPNESSNPFYVWFYKFANGVAGNFAEAMKHDMNGKK